ncbi:MAG: bifunctional diaminohydroxyphosphoribosylaminopyrimidine deaminase/5-amino-6-(5-phosphoribosylamino)uracil reductase RibD [Xanthomonadales bacterium]
MALALQLARRGLRTTDPNPRVGCVIADGERLVGQGWHEFAGGQHAEIAALNDASEPVRGLTAYVTLEPCAHHGRTPPCTGALIEAGIGRVVVAVEDPHPEVDGKGLRQLREAGVRVETGLLAAHAERLNPGFLKRARTGRPWLRVKSAASLDGRTGLAGGASKWITGDDARRDVQSWRARSSAILTGIGTVLADDPALDARVAGPVRQPLRIVVDSAWRTPSGSRVLREPEQAWIVGGARTPATEALEAAGVRCTSLPGADGRVDPARLLDALGEAELNEVQVEAGSRLCGSLLQAGLVDEILVYLAPVLLGDGGPGPFAFGPLESMQGRTHLHLVDTTHVGRDLRLRLVPSPDPDRRH